ISSPGVSFILTIAVHTEPIATHMMLPVDCSSSQLPGVLNNVPVPLGIPEQVGQQSVKIPPLPGGVMC
ncbi:MAG: hypothetical protein ACRDRV_09740, partial [Pseudonocardiaceae bacterium]